MRRRVPSLAFLALCSIAAAVPTFAQTPQNDVAVRTSLDRTAIWVGDRIVYTVEIICKRGVEVLADDLAPDKLKLEGLEIVESDTDRRATPGNGTSYQFRYVLTTYRVDVPAMAIAPLTVRYAIRRAGEEITETAPAGEVQVPGATVAFRSVLPDEADISEIRTDRPPHQRSGRFALLPAIGIGLVILSLGPALFGIAALLRRSRSGVVEGRQRIPRAVRAVRRDERESLEAVRTIDVDTLEGRREAFTRLDAIVRDHLGRVWGMAGASLTPQEVPSAAAAHDATVPAELVVTVLATCERARYAPPDAMPSADAFRNALQHAEQIVNA